MEQPGYVRSISVVREILLEEVMSPPGGSAAFSYRPTYRQDRAYASRLEASALGDLAEAPGRSATAALEFAMPGPGREASSFVSLRNDGCNSPEQTEISLRAISLVKAVSGRSRVRCLRPVAAVLIRRARETWAAVEVDEL